MKLRRSTIPDSFLLSKHSFAKEGIIGINDNTFVSGLWPLVYILLSERNKEIYIGETTNALARMGCHLGNDIRRKLDTLYLVTSDKFNKSATLDIESFLIKYLSGDGKYRLQNANAGLMDHSYYLRREYYELFRNIWGELQKREIAIQDLPRIDNSNLFKYSPYKSLTADQELAVQEIIGRLAADSPKVMVVEGGAGTGKTVLATYLMKLLKTDVNELTDTGEEEKAETYEELIRQVQRKYGKVKIGLVVPMTSLRKTLKRVFKNVGGLGSAMVIGPSEVVKEKYDILLVDEAHRLRRRRNITNYQSFDSNNSLLRLGPDGTELDWVLKQSRTCILFYDEGQSIKPSDVRKEDFEQLKSKKGTVLKKLTSQLRVKGGTDYINYLDKLFAGKLKAKDKFRSDIYELKLFDRINDLQKQLRKKEDEAGLSRMAAGYAWEWKSKKGKGYDIEIQSVQLKWNSVNEDWIHSKNAFGEVGCIHTTQGYDLNYAGIIFGKEISYDIKRNCIEVKEEHYHDRNGKNSIEDEAELHNYIVNIYKTLMCRGINGTYIYICDENLRKYFKQFIPVYDQGR